jgi:hypothetical protein
MTGVITLYQDISQFLGRSAAWSHNGILNKLMAGPSPFTLTRSLFAGNIVPIKPMDNNS